jgi:PucR C-terminal helix-turn-helix domain/GGDEF-like domain
VRVGELPDVEVRGRVLPSTGAETGLDGAFLDVVAATGLRCWLITGTGRVVAGAGELPRSIALRLAAEYQTAARRPLSPAVDQGTGGVAETVNGPFTLLPVSGSSAAGGAAVTGWFLACAGQRREWTPEQQWAAAAVAADAVHVRARTAARSSGERGLAEALIGRLAAGGDGTDGGETKALLHAADLRPGYLALALRVGDQTPDRDLAEDLVSGYTGATGRSAVAVAGDEVFAVISATDAAGLAAWLREAGPVLTAAGLALTAGIGGPADSAAALAGAVREASGVRRAAAPRVGAVAAGICVATSAEVGSHELLLASVPTPVLRSFRERLLGPLTEYDARHNAELLPTLRSFLACDGSWSACATRMYVHVNTVRYRIGRIEALTGRDLSALADRVDFFLALRGA